ncbi:MAG TPA: DUF2283 domain-containing protein [Acetobacteraceae bacterium]|nr:DUF2283 domain-containing protein [Acetobacteraceae bacterium]
MIKTSYDPEADALSVHFGPEGACVESDEVAPGIILDYDAQGNVVGVEVLDVRMRIAGRYPAHARKRAAAD